MKFVTWSLITGLFWDMLYEDFTGELLNVFVDTGFKSTSMSIFNFSLAFLNWLNQNSITSAFHHFPQIWYCQMYNFSISLTIRWGGIAISFKTLLIMLPYNFFVNNFITLVKVENLLQKCFTNNYTCTCLKVLLKDKIKQFRKLIYVQFI